MGYIFRSYMFFVWYERGKARLYICFFPGQNTNMPETWQIFLPPEKQNHPCSTIRSCFPPRPWLSKMTSQGFMRPRRSCQWCICPSCTVMRCFGNCDKYVYMYVLHHIWLDELFLDIMDVIFQKTNLPKNAPQWILAIFPGFQMSFLEKIGATVGSAANRAGLDRFIRRLLWA